MGELRLYASRLVCGSVVHPLITVSRTRKLASEKSFRTQEWGVAGPQAVVLVVPPDDGKREVAALATGVVRLGVAIWLPQFVPPFQETSAFIVVPAQADAIQVLLGFLLQTSGFEKCRVEVGRDTGRVDARARLHDARPAHEQRFANTAFVEPTLAGAKRGVRAETAGCATPNLDEVRAEHIPDESRLVLFGDERRVV